MSKGSTSQFIELAPKQVCQGVQHLNEFFQDIVDNGGEGIILRDPSSPFQSGRSAGFLKHKVSSYSKAHCIVY